MADLPLILERTLAPNREVIQQAEQELTAASLIPGHHLRILQLIADDTVSLGIRQAAGIHFKNSVKFNWEDAAQFPPDAKDMIRRNVVDLMCRVPAQLQELLSESIALIAKNDYPDHWQSLLPDLVQRFRAQSSDTVVLNGLLKTANSIFKAFRYVERSDELYRVIIYTLNGIQEPVSLLFASISADLKALGKIDAIRDEARLESLRLICRIFYSLNYQDLPEYFEDNLRPWMEEFAHYLTLTDDGGDPDEGANGVDKLQSAILSVLDLYAERDEEPFEEYLPTFTKLVWELLNGKKPRHDTLTVASIQFLSLLIEKPAHKALFEKPETIKLILVQIVIPNLAFRDSDMEKFEDDPADFMLTEVEGSSSESRRRKAQICLKSLCKSFNDITVALVQEHVALLLTEYQRDLTQWAKKDVAIHLIMGVAIMRDTVSFGVSEVNPSVNIADFFQQQILPELQDPSTVANRPVVKATAIKFIATFRFQFSREQLVDIIKLLIPFYKSQEVVIHTYAAYATERILFTKESMSGPGSKVARIRNTDLAPIVEPIFNGLFAIVEQIDERENEYAMKAIMRVLITANRDILPVYEVVLERLSYLVQRIANNPRNPDFNHCLFDSIACIVRTVCKADGNAVAKVENLLSSIFMQLLKEQVAEFTPYVFQILAQILEFRPAGLGENFKALFAPLLSPELWSQQGNVPALTRLMKAYISKSPSELSASVVPLLGIFQKLIALPVTEISAYSLLRCILASFPPESFQALMRDVFQVILSTIQYRPESKQRKKDQAVAFFSFFVGKFGVTAFNDTLGTLGNDLGMTVITKVWAPTLTETTPKAPLTAKEHMVGLTRLLTETPTLLATPEARRAWLELLVAVTRTIASPEYSKLSAGAPDLSSPELAMVFDNTFSQLGCAKVAETDYFADIANAGSVFCQTLQRFVNQNRENLIPLIQQDMNAGAVADAFERAGFPLA